MKKTLLSITILAASIAAANAAAITIENSSFETAALDPGGWNNTLDSWVNPGVAGDTFIEYIAGFSAEGDQHIGLQAPAGGGIQTIYQDLAESFAPNTVYSLVAATGNRNASFSTPGVSSAIYGLADSSGSVLASIEALAPAAESTFEDGPTLTFTTPASGGPNGPIRIVLMNDSATPGRAHFDNIRLDASPIPEPVTTGLIALGSVLLLRRRRR